MRVPLSQERDNRELVSMHGLTSDVDLEFIVGREVIQIAIGVHQVIVAFDQNLKISIEGEFEYITKVARVKWRPSASEVAAKTVGLLGLRVGSISSQTDGALELSFSNGDRLVLKDTNPEYESYQIVTSEKTMVV